MLRFLSRLKLTNKYCVHFYRSPINRTKQSCSNYSQSTKGDDVVVNRSKKFIFAGVFTLSAIGFAWYVKREKEIAEMKERQRQMKKVAVSDKWQLIDSDGKTRTAEDFLGKWCIMYFGFTHCPDICPDEMEKMTAVVNDLEEKKVELQPVFITVDPDRDTKEVVGKYVKEFSPKIIGLTGTPEQLKIAGHKFHVYFKAGPKDKENDYIVDHTIILYLVDPHGEFVDFYGLGKTKDDITASVIVNIDKWNQLNKKKNWFSF